MAETFIWTAQDELERLLVTQEYNNTGRQRQLARTAILNCLREFPNRTRWSYYDRRYTLRTVASQTGTVTYDHCVTPDHEALTRFGWKTVDQLSVGDEILSYDHDTETCSWLPIEALHTFDYDGEVLEVTRKGRTVLRCTPNHRVPVWERYGQTDNRKVRKRFVKASELTIEHTTPLAAPLDQELSGMLSPRLSAILAWIVTDGTGLGKQHESILQSYAANPEKCLEISLLTGSPVGPNADGYCRFGVDVDDKRMIRKLCSTKNDLVSAVCWMGVSQAEAVKHAMIQAEASTNRDSYKVFTQWGENKPVAEAFQIACILSGHAANISERAFVCDGFGKGQVKTRFQVPVRTSRGIKLAKQSKWVPYRGRVWCPQVRTSAWVMRCNGAVMITGNSGGASERLLTLATATLPTDGTGEFYRVIIGDTHYDIQRVLSASTCQLSPNNNPGADVTAGTACTVYRAIYPLPVGFRKLCHVYDVEQEREVYVVPLDEWHAQSISVFDSPATVEYCAVTSAGELLSALMLVFSPPPLEAKTFDILYEAGAQHIRTWVYSTGTVTTDGSATLAFSGTALTSNHAGAIIRFSTSTTVLPTPQVGNMDNVDNPYRYQRVLIDVTSTTAAVTDATVAALTGVKYTISDPIDIESGAMLVAFQKACDAEYASLLRTEDWQMKLAVADRSLRVAMENDQRTTYAKGQSPLLYDKFRRVTVTTD